MNMYGSPTLRLKPLNSLERIFIMSLVDRAIHMIKMMVGTTRTYSIGHWDFQDPYKWLLEAMPVTKFKDHYKYALSGLRIINRRISQSWWPMISESASYLPSSLDKIWIFKLYKIIVRLCHVDYLSLLCVLHLNCCWFAARHWLRVA